jgi:hypothetical protein
MSINLNHRIRRAGFAALATIVGLAGLLPIAMQDVSAAGQVTLRSIEMSDATASHPSTSYKVSFTPFTTGTQSLVIDFCSNSSIIGGTCTAPGSMDANTSIGFTAGTNTTSWVVDTSTAIDTVSRVTVNKGAGSGLTTAAADFTLTGITNPAATGSFWARIYTYSDATYGSTGTVYSSPTVLGTYVDYGGFALSTATLINITATVMETLTFCVSKLAPGPTCGASGQAVTTPTLILGHGSPQVLDASAIDTDDAYTQISTNAINGVVVRLKTHNSCTGLSRDGGGTCPIPGVGAFAALVAGTVNFGLNVADGTGGTGTVVHNANYGTTGGSYGMGASVTSTYGDPIEDTAAAPTSNVNSQLLFAATAAVTTPAGVYSTNESLIATGTF